MHAREQPIPQLLREVAPELPVPDLRPGLQANLRHQTRRPFLQEPLDDPEPIRGTDSVQSQQEALLPDRIPRQESHGRFRIVPVVLGASGELDPVQHPVREGGHDGPLGEGHLGGQRQGDQGDHGPNPHQNPAKASSSVSMTEKTEWRLVMRMRLEIRALRPQILSSPPRFLMAV